LTGKKAKGYFSLNFKSTTSEIKPHGAFEITKGDRFIFLPPLRRAVRMNSHFPSARK